MWGRSKCPQCKSVIRWYDNVPVVSFILLRSKCRNCKKKISWQYPLVEIGTGTLFALTGLKIIDASSVNTWLMAGHMLVFFSFLVVIFIYDWLYMEISSLVLWVAIVWTILFNLFFDWITNERGIAHILNLSTYSGVLGACAGFLFFFSLVAISKEKWMGEGDAYLAILLGLFLGWPKILPAVIIAFLIGAATGITLIAVEKKHMKSQIPFAPFLVLGTIISAFFYKEIVSWYFGFLF